MEGANKKHISESFRLAAVLALVGGFLDAYTYICRGQVFSNAQTGNIAFFTSDSIYSRCNNYRDNKKKGKV